MGNFEKLSYNPETGVFSWVKSGSGIKKEKEVGSIQKNGYRRIKVNRKKYFAHRLAWFMVYGKWPDYQIDHINGDRLDNRIANLRDVNANLNMQNQRKPMSTNKSGLLGVFFDKRKKRWKATIVLNRKNIHIGYFLDKEIAYQAYLTKKRELHLSCTI